ncbi:hypothetical protein G7Y29_03685 [Corynebacterium qintianiae]|uniref:Uncharacterized protein n=1 Tax=Corynebacterium qintianiae TaxID=2709392 RepID=A0A7T0KPC9_9CORY|nr:DUF5997 family protein [Corynebacterium qintianiae]QPK83905.1 hypothetical protein G7Y29_03685 [Corynebacterium qintianiae]
MTDNSTAINSTASNPFDREPSGTAMKPATAAAKLGIYLPATPAEFRNGAVTHAQLRELQTNPPEWLSELRLNGPHPRPEVARKLGISITALKKNGMDEPLTTEQISELLQNQPEWLRLARTVKASSSSPDPDTEGTS